jgi:serine/threonine-protein kinase RsbT
MEIKGGGRVRIDSEGDIVTVRKVVRNASMELGFTVTDVTRIVTAASELTRNIYRFAGSGSVEWRILEENSKAGVELTFIDHGPGIANIDQALMPGYTTGGGMGLGLPGAKRLMDYMEIQSDMGKGTTVTVGKWKSR